MSNLLNENDQKFQQFSLFVVKNTHGKSLVEVLIKRQWSHTIIP